MKNIKVEVGDFVIYEHHRDGFQRPCTFDFRVGKVVWMNSYYALVEMHPAYHCKVMLDEIIAKGSRLELIKFCDQLSELSKAREEAIKEAMKVAESKINDVAGKHAGKMRAAIKNLLKEKILGGADVGIVG